MGFDATTLGNHEFDYGVSGFAQMMNHAAKSDDALPAMVICNVDWDCMEEKGLTKEQKQLKEAFDTYGVKEYIIVEKNGVRIGITGVFGIDALACVPNCPIEFKNPVDALKETVSRMRDKEDVDMIVLVSHSGTADDEKKSEDEILAKSVPELDLIISGHTHTILQEPIVHGNTYIVSAAEYGKYLGSLSLTQQEDGRWKLENYDLIEVNESVITDKDTQKKVDAFMAMVDTKYMKRYGFHKDQVLCTNEVNFVPQDYVNTHHTELNLGSFMADAYTYAVEELMGEGMVDVAVVPSGTIRDSFPTGQLTVEHAFNSYSIGVGADGTPIYPLIGAYLTGKELKAVAEIDASISNFMTVARLYTDGLYWHYNPNRMILNKVTDIFLCNGKEERVELKDDRLYYLVTDYYTSQMLGGVTKMSYGLLSIIPKNADGTPIENFEDAIIMDGGEELKPWTAIARYMKSFEDTDGDGIGNVPAKYASLEGRKVIEDSKNIVDLVKNPNKFFFLILAVFAVVIAVFVGIILLLRKKIKKEMPQKHQNY